MNNLINKSAVAKRLLTGHPAKLGRAKKNIATFSVALLALSLIFQQTANTANALAYKGDERDLLASDLDQHTLICNGSQNQSKSDVAVDDNRLQTLVWQDDNCDGSGNGTGIYMQRRDTQLGATPSIGAPTRVNDIVSGNQQNPSIAMDHEGNYVIAWSDDGSGTGDTEGIYVRTFNSNGTPLGPSMLVNTHTGGTQNHPKVAIEFGENPSVDHTGHFVVVWQGEGDTGPDGIYMQRYNIDFSASVSGTPVGSNISVNTYTTGVQENPDVSISNSIDGFQQTIVTWDGPGTGFPSSNEVWMQAYDANNTPLGGTPNNVRVNSTSPATNPAIATDKSSEPSGNEIPGGKSVIVYKAGSNNEIDGKTIDPCTGSGCTLGGVELNFSTKTSDLPDVAMDYMGNFTVTWQQDDGPSAGNLNIRGINYDYLGHRIDADFRVNENAYFDGDQAQTMPAIAKDKDGEYIITWASQQSASNSDIRYRLFGTDVFKQGQETQANNTTTSNSEYFETTAIAPNGNHVVAWVGTDQVSGQSRIFYSLYDSSGNLISNGGGPVKNVAADTVNDSSTYGPAVSFFKDTAGTDVGRFIIAWIGNDPNNAGVHPVMYREFDASGTPVTPTELPLSAVPSGSDSFFNVRISAGYYNNSGSAVIDRFAAVYSLYHFGIDTPSSTRSETSAYHTDSGFTYNDLQPASNNCYTYCNGQGVDLFPDISGNDREIYTWDYVNGSHSGIFAQEANGAAFSGSPFQVNDNPTVPVNEDLPDVAFVSPTQYVISWQKCDDDFCTYPSIYAKRYTGDFTGNAPTVTDDDFVVYPGLTPEHLSNNNPRIAADTSSGSFLITWNKIYNDTPAPNYEIDGKFFDSSPALSNFGVGFVINTTQNGQDYSPDVSMNDSGLAVVAWEGGHQDATGTLIDNDGAMFQLLNNFPTVATIPELPTAAQLSIVANGKTLAIPSQINFPTITANSMNNTDVEREVDENPATGQPPYFQLEDLGGNSNNCTSGTCYSVSVNSSDFTYTDPATEQTYYIPAANISVENYDGNHPGVGTGACGTAGAELSTLYGNASDFSLDPSTCSYTPLATLISPHNHAYDLPDETFQALTLVNKVTNTSDTGKIRWFPKFKITVPPLTPPGTYTGTITITSA